VPALLRAAAGCFENFDWSIFLEPMAQYGAYWSRNLICKSWTRMIGDATDRADTLRIEAARCLEHAKTAATPKIRDDLIALAAKFHELANSTALHDFGAIMQAVNEAQVGEIILRPRRAAWGAPPGT
jgi:hypothetical protein